jgi:hypothetical protein
VKRREFLSVLGASATWPVAVRAQTLSRVPHVGIVDFFSSAASSDFIDPFQEGFKCARRADRIDVHQTAPHKRCAPSARRYCGSLMNERLGGSALHGAVGCLRGCQRVRLCLATRHAVTPPSRALLIRALKRRGGLRLPQCPEPGRQIERVGSIKLPVAKSAVA